MYTDQKDRLNTQRPREPEMEIRDKRSDGRAVSRMGRIAVLSALLFGLAWVPVYAQINQWTNVGPVGGANRFLVIDPQDPSTFYVGTAVGVFKSKDGGTSWINTGMVAAGLVIDHKNPA